jgi:hypothetical protein
MSPSADDGMCSYYIVSAGDQPILECFTNRLLINGDVYILYCFGSRLADDGMFHQAPHEMSTFYIGSAAD